MEQNNSDLSVPQLYEWVGESRVPTLQFAQNSGTQLPLRVGTKYEGNVSTDICPSTGGGRGSGERVPLVSGPGSFFKGDIPVRYEAGVPPQHTTRAGVSPSPSRLPWI